MSGRRRDKGTRRILFLATLGAAPLLGSPFLASAAEPKFRPPVNRTPAASQESALPPIVSPSSAPRPRPGKSTTTAVESSERMEAKPPSATQPAASGSRLARFQAAMAEMTSPPGDAKTTNTPAGSAGGSGSPWMQTIDPALRGKEAPVISASTKEVEPVRYQAKIEDNVSTVVRVQTDDSEPSAADNPASTNEEPATNEGISKNEATNHPAASPIPTRGIGGGLQKMLGLKPLPSRASLQTARASFSEGAQNAALTEAPALQRIAEDQAEETKATTPRTCSLSAEEEADCRKLEDELSSLFPERHIQVIVGRDRARPHDDGCEIIAIIRRPSTAPRTSETRDGGSVLKSPTAAAKSIIH